jgi:hypothetical protein
LSSYVCYRMGKADSQGLSDAKAKAVAPRKPRLLKLVHYYMQTCKDRFIDLLQEDLEAERKLPESERRAEITIRNSAALAGLDRETEEFQEEMNDACLEEHDAALVESEETILAAKKARPTAADHRACVSSPSSWRSSLTLIRLQAREDHGCLADNKHPRYTLLLGP